MGVALLLNVKHLFIRGIDFLDINVREPAEQCRTFISMPTSPALDASSPPTVVADEAATLLLGFEQEVIVTSKNS